MIQEKIQSARKALQELGGQVPQPVWDIIRAANAELADAADCARRLEGATLVDTLPLPTFNTH